MPINKETHVYFPFPIGKAAVASLREAAERYNISMAMIIRAGIRLALVKLARVGPGPWIVD